MPKKFDLVQVWRFGRRNPPVDVVFFHEGFGLIAGVLGVIVLSKPKTVWESLSDEWQEPLDQNLCHMEFSIPDALKIISLVGPCLQILAQMWTFTGCFGRPFTLCCSHLLWKVILL